jgi:hypothetical protein
MSRVKIAGVAFTLVGAIAASTVIGRGLWVAGFFVLLFGGVAAALVLLSGGNWSAEDPEPIDIANTDPYIDEHGIVHYPGDPFELENHPVPGAHGRI